MHTNSTLYTRISPQWLSELRWLWLSVPWRVACELISWQVSTLCLHSSIVSPFQLRWVKGVCMCRCNLPVPPALLAEWPGSFTCHCGNTRVERTPNKSQHTKLTLEKKILPPLLPGFELATFQSWVRCSYQQAIPAPKRRCCFYLLLLQMSNNAVRFTLGIHSCDTWEGMLVFVIILLVCELWSWVQEKLS